MSQKNSPTYMFVFRYPANEPERSPEEMQKIRDLLGGAFGAGKYDDAAKIFADLVNNDTFVEFLTLPAYERID